jgi:hypothetical protein
MQCVVCGTPLIGKRNSNARTCGPRCRQTLHRHPERAALSAEGSGVASPKPDRGAEPTLSEQELLGIVEAAASSGSWQAARWLIERADRTGPASQEPDPFAEVTDIYRRRRPR